MPSRRQFIAMTTVIALLALAAGVVFVPHRDESLTSATVTVPAGPFSYRAAGDFSRGTRPVDAPMRDVRFSTPLTIMKNLVSEADYQLCVIDKTCKPLAQPSNIRDDHPVTGTSWEDASDYANWLSRKTGQNWRLPSDAEWSYIAGSKFTDDALQLGDEADFSQRWIAKYDQESALRTEGTDNPQPLGTFGVNENGLTDLAGNVWEWTDTCFIRQNLGADGESPGEPFTVCGIRVAAGKHRAYVSDFTRDARGGGCAVGIPPSNLGFRLVMDGTSSLWQRLRQSL